MNMQTFALAVAAASALFTLDHAAAACRNPHSTCLDIQWCMTPSGREFSGPITTAARNGDGNGVGVDTAACQHKYGQPGPGGSWDTVSAGCSNPEYAAIGKKALNGVPACD